MGVDFLLSVPPYTLVWLTCFAFMVLCLKDTFCIPTRFCTISRSFTLRASFSAPFA